MLIFVHFNVIGLLGRKEKRLDGMVKLKETENHNLFNVCYTLCNKKFFEIGDL